MTHSDDPDPVDSPGLEHAVAAEASAWVMRHMNTLAQQNRPIAGGWPGTISEARALVITRILPLLAPTVVDADAIDRLVHAVYLTAKKAWLAQAANNPPL